MRVEAALGSRGTGGRGLLPCSGRRKRLHSIGVSVSETKPETRIATQMVTANSCSSRPTMPPMNSTGMNTATSEMRHRHDGEADLARAVERGLQRRLAHLHVADDVLQHHDGVVHHEADGQRERHAARGCPGCSRAGTSPQNVPTIDIGSARLGMSVADRLRRNRKITSTTSASASTSVNCTSWTDSRIDAERSKQDVELDAGRELRAELRAAACGCASTTSTVFVPGWRWMASTMPRLSLNQAAMLVVLHAVDDACRGRSSRTGAPLR